MELGRHKGHGHADQTPGEHDAGNPFGSREFRCHQRAGNLEDEVAHEEDAGTGTEYLRGNPGKVLGHGELGIGHVDAVNAGDDGD